MSRSYSSKPFYTATDLKQLKMIPNLILGDVEIKLNTTDLIKHDCVKVLLNSFRLNGLTLGFHSQT